MIRTQSQPVTAPATNGQSVKYTQSAIINASRLTHECLELAKESGMSDPKVVSGLREIRKLGEHGLDSIVETLHKANSHEDVFNGFIRLALRINKKRAAQEIAGLVNTGDKDTCRQAMKALIFSKRIYPNLTMQEIPTEVLVRALLNDPPIGELSISKSTHILRALSDQASQNPVAVRATLDAHQNKIEPGTMLQKLQRRLSIREVHQAAF